MSDSKSIFREKILFAVNEIIKEKGGIEPVSEEKIVVQNAPDSSLGDIGSPMFVFAKTLSMAPQIIAKTVVEKINKSIEENGESSPGEFIVAGPYVNLKFDKCREFEEVLSKIEKEGNDYGSFAENGKKHLDGRRIMIEFSSPNTNKPLHLGHMRNDAIGESMSRILKKAGAEVYKVNIINNRGIHICKSMYAYKMFHEEKGETPESLGMKGDHFVGQCYVEYSKYEKEHPEVSKEVEEMLIKWENGDKEVRALWEKMNEWTLNGIKETYERTGVSFDKLYYESEMYITGKEEILKGLEKGIFFKAEDGSIRVDVTEASGKGKDGEDHEKVLLRKDGTSVYITQDIGLAIHRHEDWPFNQMIYVTATEQIYHFKVLFYILKKLGFDWAEKMFHLSYGLVNLPNGRMKSREGTVVDADDLIDSLGKSALDAIKEKGREDAVDCPEAVAEKVALAALHYYLLQVSPVKDMVFNPEESLSFNGNTGPYLEYMGARISSILRKAEESGISIASVKEAAKYLGTEEEWELLRRLSEYPDAVSRAAQNLDASVMPSYLYDVSKLFSKFYQQCPILSAEDENVKSARLCLSSFVLKVMKDAMELVLVPYLDRM